MELKDESNLHTNFFLKRKKRFQGEQKNNLHTREKGFKVE
jgi:hypothetical protein